MRLSIVILLSIFLQSLTVSYASAQQTELPPEIVTFEEKIAGLYETLADKEQDKVSLETRIERQTDEVRKQQLTQELAAAEDVIRGLREEIVSLSVGGAELFVEPPVEKEEFNWKKDLEQIFEPLLDQLRDITERPRIIEKLEAEIEYWQSRERELTLAVTNLRTNMVNVKNQDLRNELQELLDAATAREKTAKQKLTLLRNELSSIEKQDSPIWQSLSDIFMRTFVGMIVHLLIAIGAAFLIFHLVRFLSLLPINVLHKRQGENVFAERAIVVGRTILGGILSLITYFVVLYSFSEWLLLVLSLLIIAGVVLGLKEAVPAYFKEIKTLLNMGSIRQGERLNYNGLPWLIKKLNVHTHLYNPLLHGHLRVPLSEILMMSSRPFHQEEPWFPTDVGDVIFLEDDTFGRIKQQTPDVVEVELGGSIFTYQTADFLARRPRNLSRDGFTIYETVGYDYQHQADITDKILNTYTQAIEQTIKQSDFGKFNTYLGVEFDAAAASSLDFKIIAAFTGEVAMDFFKIKRLLQKASVEVANKHGWVIPFQQMTVHYQPVES